MTAQPKMSKAERKNEREKAKVKLLIENAGPAFINMTKELSHTRRVNSSS
jgi:hypothetical protein